MYGRTWAVAGCFMAFAGSAMASDRVVVGATALYVPNGFDNNDNVEVVVEGNLADSCYQLDNLGIAKDAATKTITITVNAWREEELNCTPGPFSFVREVELGTLEDGAWTVQVAGTALSQSLTVARASTTGQDDYIYAPVDDVSVAGAQVTLSGVINADCLQYKETKVLDQGSVVVLLPVLEITSTECQQASRPFTEKVTLPEDLAAGRHLLHVRSLNGKAVNQLFDINQ